MAAPDYEFIDGFDKYGPVNNDLTQVANTPLWADEWSSISGNGYAYARVIPPLNGVIAGHAGMQLTSGFGNSVCVMSKSVPGNYARCLGGFTYNPTDGFSISPIYFRDGLTVQLTLQLNAATGKIQIYRGNVGTLLATSVETITQGTTRVVEWDITFHGSTGIIKIYLDGVLTSINLSAQNTITSGNAYANSFVLNSMGQNTAVFRLDHLYTWWYLVAGGTETPALSNPIIETSAPVGDSATIAWAVNGHGFLTPNYYWGSSQSSVSPGAGSLYLRRVVADVAGSISGLVVSRPGTTSAIAKFKAAIYADTAGAPGALLATGTEVVGVTSGTALTLPVALAGITAATGYWVGFIADTNIAFGCNDDAPLSSFKANTYASGPPSPAGTGFNTTTYNANMVVAMTGVTTHYTQENAFPAAVMNAGYNFSSTVAQQDLFSFPPLSSTPALIYSVAVKGLLSRSDAGARTIKFACKSAAVVGYGNNVAVTPSVGYATESALFKNDPNTAGSWATAALNAAYFGVEVAT